MMRSGAAAVGLALVVLVGCGSDSDPADPSSTSPSASSPATTGAAGLANPASEFCIAQGGTVEIETADDGGQAGICVLPDGTRIDEWEYFRSEGGASTTDG